MIVSGRSAIGLYFPRDGHARRYKHMEMEMEMEMEIAPMHS